MKNLQLKYTDFSDTNCPEQELKESVEKVELVVEQFTRAS